MKRGLPSDSAISPSFAAPTKSLCHGEDQRRVKSAKSLSYEEILPKPNPEEVIHVPLTMVLPTLPSLDFVVANNVKVSSEGHCDGDTCKVQAIVTYESGRKTGELPKDLHRLGKALARGSAQSNCRRSYELPRSKESHRGLHLFGSK